MNTNRIFAATATAAILVAAACADQTGIVAPTASPRVPSFAITDDPGTPVSGAVFTNVFAEGACTGVDANIYESKDAVGLNGGPRAANAAALPDGGYFVMVTDPSGQTILGMGVSGTDAAGQPIPSRVVEVVDGKFKNCYQLSAILKAAAGGYSAAGYDDSPNNGGEYKVWVSSRSDFAQNATKTDNFKVRSGGGGGGGDPEPLRIRVQKFYDANANGTLDGTESLINDWKVNLYSTSGAAFDAEALTPAQWTLGFATYTAREAQPIATIGISWYPTTATTVAGIAPSAGLGTLVRFGNVCTGAGGGLTLGYWSNQNGRADLGGVNANGTSTLAMTASLGRLTALNLRSPNGSPFDPTTYAAYRTWLLNGNAVNMSYMLSVQLSAMSNNVATSRVSPTALIYAPGTGVENSAGFATVEAVMTAANTRLGAQGITTTAGDERTLQENLKNALDNANNNRNFVQSSPCAFSFSTPATYYDAQN